MSVEPTVKLPDDTVAEIVSAGLLGDKYMSLVPGGSDKDDPAGRDRSNSRNPRSASRT